MSFFPPDFWPWYWALFSVAAVATAVLSLLVASTLRPGPGPHFRPHAPQTPPPVRREPVAGPPAGKKQPAGRRHRSRLIHA